MLKKIDFHPWDSEPQVGEFFDKLIDLHGCQTGLEIGVFRGLTSYYLLEKMKADFCGIDIEDHREPSIKEMWEKNNCWFIKNDSFTVLDAFILEERKFDFIFIDSFHSYEQCSGEYWRARKCINPGGLICFHDSILIEGVIQFVAELKSKQRELGIELLTLNTPSIEGRGGSSGLTIVRHND